MKWTWLMIIAALQGYGASMPRDTKERIRQEGAMLPTAAQFSGAFQWAHKRGLTGKGQTALVIESGFHDTKIRTDIPSAMKEEAVSLLQKGKAEGSKQNAGGVMDRIWGSSSPHESAVAHVLHQIAPESSIVSIPLDFNRKLETFPENVQEGIRDAFVINMSFGPSPAQPISSSMLLVAMMGFLEKILRFGADRKLVITSAGNYKIDLSFSPRNLSVGAYVENSSIQPVLIIAGNVDHNFTLSPFSNFPGHKQEIQNNFLCALGESVGTFTDGLYKKVGGTSLSAPTISGAALLLKEKYPHLTATEIKEVLLESACRTFVVNKAGVPTIITDKPRVELVGWRWRVVEEKLPVEEFDKKIYGKGILDIRAADIYASLLSQNLNQVRSGVEKEPSKSGPLPRKTPEMLRKDMLAQLGTENREAAMLIQKWYRGKIEERKAAIREATQRYEEIFKLSSKQRLEGTRALRVLYEKRYGREAAQKILNKAVRR